jgi:hypothetical protein
MAISVTPANPGWPPNPVRCPAPAQATMAKPAAVMKRRPAPCVIGTPIPTAIGPHPASTIVVGCPTGIDHHRGGLPASTIPPHIYPVPVRSQRTVKSRIVRYFGWCSCGLGRILHSHSIRLGRDFRGIWSNRRFLGRRRRSRSQSRG